MEIDKAIQRLPKSSSKPQIHKFPVHSGFMMPLEITDVEAAIEKLGPGLTDGLEVILLLAGTTRQKSFRRGARFGLYSVARGLVLYSNHLI